MTHEVGLYTVASKSKPLPIYQKYIKSY